MATRMQQRRGTAAQWTAADPILAAGEIGFETDTGKFKIGNGSSIWSALSYFADSQDFSSANVVMNSEKGSANGVAPLNADGLIPLAYMAKLIEGTSVNLDTFAEVATAIEALQEHEAATTQIHGITDTSDLVISSQLSSAISVHNLLTENIHGIEDTAELATKDYADTAAATAASSAQSTAQSFATTAANNAQSAAEDYADSVSSTGITAHNAVTTNVHGILDTADLALLSDVSDAQSAAEDYADSVSSTGITAHNAVTTNVHGILDTADLALLSDVSDAQSAAEDYADSVSSTGITAHNAVTTNVHGILDTTQLATKAYADAAASAVSDDLDSHANDTTGIHGITDTSLLVTTDGSQTLTNKTLTSPVINTPTGITKSDVGLENVNNTSDADKPISTATQTALDLKAAIASPALTGTPTAPTATAGTNTTQIATTAYADTAVSSAITNHNSDTENVHGIADTADLVLTNDARLSDERTPVDGSVTTAKIATGGIAQSAVTNLTTDLAAKATLVSPALTGTPTAPTATLGTNTTQIATTAFVKAEVDALVAAAPGALNTLDELAAALGDDANFASTVTASLATKASTTDLNNALLYSFNNETASYTLALSDATNMVEMESSSSTTVTVPPNASVAFSIGATIDIFQKGTGQVTIAEGSGVTIYATPGKKLRTQYSGATLIKRDTNTWILTGDLSA
jgi:hypothetical protein